MSVPDLSFARTVAQWRYIQSIHETNERRNPDGLVGQLLPLRERWGARWLSGRRIEALRLHRFYYYLVSRTKYYDKVFLDAIDQGARHIVNVGCGTDTRAYRFAATLARTGTTVCECDQPAVIAAKQQSCARRWPSSPVCYLALDLRQERWPEFAAWLDGNIVGPALVLMEGVTPYIDARSVSEFLSLLAASLPRGSRVAYDFKISGVADDFGRDSRVACPFRLPSSRDEVARYHRARGLRLAHMVLSDELSMQFIPDLDPGVVPLFREDAVVGLELEPR